MTTDFSDSICIAYPASWPTTVDEPHCTLIYLGKISEADFTKQQLLDVLDDIQLPAPGFVETTTVEYFGKEKNIPVVKLFSLRVLAHRAIIAFELEHIGISSPSEFEFTPHISLSYDEDHKVDESEIPDQVYLDAPVLWWGEDRD